MYRAGRGCQLEACYKGRLRGKEGRMLNVHAGYLAFADIQITGTRPPPRTNVMKIARSLYARRNYLCIISYYYVHFVKVVEQSRCGASASRAAP